jgi:hypothetical protein
MNSSRVLGIILMAAGALSLAYGGFSYTKSRSEVDLGPLSFEVQERKRVDLPIWLGVGLLVAGGGILAFAGRNP